MTDQYAVTVQRLRRLLQNPVLVKHDVGRNLGLAAIDAFEEVCRGVPLSQDHLLAISQAMHSPEREVSVAGSELIESLAVDNLAARDLILRIAKEGNDDARCAALLTVDCHIGLPRSFLVDVLRIGLADRTLHNRMIAACDAGMGGFAEVLAQMEELRESLPSMDTSGQHNAAGWLNLYIDLARDGYSLDQMSEQDAESLRGGSESARARFQSPVYNIKVRLLNRKALTGGFVSEKELQLRGAPAIADEVRQRFLAGEQARAAKSTLPHAATETAS